MYHLHGFEPGEVIPTTRLMLAHREAAHGAAEEDDLRVLIDLTRPAEAFASTYRMVDATGRRRAVALVGRVLPADEGCARVAEGFLVDLTGDERARLEADMHTAVASFRARAATIEQAKGILMEMSALTADEAFEVLKDHSNHANIRLHTLADRLVHHEPPAGARATGPHAGDPDLIRRLGLSVPPLAAASVDLRWPAPRQAVLRVAGELGAADVHLIDDSVDVVLRAAPSVLTVRLDVGDAHGLGVVVPAVRRALVRLHHAGAAVSVTGAPSPPRPSGGAGPA